MVAKVKRIGGGFGGKETRASILAVPVAIAAYKLKKPVRAVFDREEDMQVTGYRHPCLIEYEVAFDNDGKIMGARFQVYSNAGNSMDISCSVRIYYLEAHPLGTCCIAVGEKNGERGGEGRSIYVKTGHRVWRDVLGVLVKKC